MPATTDGIDLYCDSEGQGDPLLLIHGLGSSSEDWALQVRAFSERYRVLRCDLRGHGRRLDAPGPYTVERMAADVAELLRGSRENHPAHIAGVSLGGAVALQLAVDAPELLRSLVVVNCPVDFIPQTPGERFMLFKRQMTVRCLGMRRVGIILARRLLPGDQHRALRSELVERFARNDRRVNLACIRSMSRWSVEAQLPEIEVPTLIVCSEHDYTPVSRKQVFVERMPNAQLAVIPGARHGVPLQKPEEFNRLVLEFLEQLSPSQSEGTL